MPLVIDPPRGWMYGFPRILPRTYKTWSEKEFKAWLIRAGYPQYRVDNAIHHCRFWEISKEEASRHESVIP